VPNALRTGVVVPKVSDEYLAERRRHIVDTARGLFAERGFAATSMADLVAATGLSVGALYRYFPSKAALVAAAVEGRDGQRGAGTAEPGGGPGQVPDSAGQDVPGGGFDEHEPAGELVDRLLGYVTATPQARSHARLVTQVWAEAARSPEVAALSLQRHMALQDHLARSLTGQVRAGAEQSTAELVLAALVGVATLTAVGHDMHVTALGQTLHQLVGDRGVEAEPK
jgi:AcrR family transcriptional regulator